MALVRARHRIKLIVEIEVISVGCAMASLDSAVDVDITHALHARAESPRDHLREKLALQDLASQMADRPGNLLPRLVNLAMETCGATSAGISILESNIGKFRWCGLQGALSVFEGAKTPREHSPCGVCLDYSSPVLMEYPERAYDWIAEANITVPELLLVPLKAEGLGSIGTLWAIAENKGHFNFSHARSLSELSTFAAMALRMILAEERLQLALQEQETLTREMSHRVKNLFAVSLGIITITARSVDTKEELVTKLTGRMQALADANALVRRSFADNASTESVDLQKLLIRILRPHDEKKSQIHGPQISIGERATNSLALVFHELATNSAKYGALLSDSGSIKVTWKSEDAQLSLIWLEEGGAQVEAPSDKGFGARLIAMTIKSLGGAVEYDWQRQGLIARLTLPLAALQA